MIPTSRISTTDGTLLMQPVPQPWRLCTWAVEEHVVVLQVPEALLQPAGVAGQVLHAEHQPAVGPEPQRLVLHHILHLDQLPDVCNDTRAALPAPLPPAVPRRAPRAAAAAAAHLP